MPLRTGKMRIEYSPELIKSFSDAQLEELLKVELIRILLLHPYTRLPYKAKRSALLLASDVTINQFYQMREGIELSGVSYLKTESRRFHELTYPLGEKWSGTEEEKFFLRNLNIDPGTRSSKTSREPSKGDTAREVDTASGIDASRGVDSSTRELKTVDDLSFEQWYKKILFLIENTSIKGENAGSSEGKLFSAADNEAELWEENEEAQKAISEEIKKAYIDNGWGSLGGEVERRITEKSDFSMNYRRVLSRFRAQITNSKRNLTRTKPSRRFGFSQMGSRYERKANILVAIDVSGSITDESIAKFFHVINSFFFCGIEKLDAIFFDVNLKSTKPVTLKKRFSISSIKGHGGTSFQAPIDFFLEHKEYDGLIIFTDGEANPPSLNGRKATILWILTERLCWEKSRVWIDRMNGSYCTYIP